MANRLLGTLIVHVVAAAALAALLWWLCSDAKTLLRPEVYNGFETAADRERARLFLDAALRTAGLATMLVSLACAVIWLFICESKPPAGNTGAAAQRGSWTGMLFAALIGGGITLWATIWSVPRVMRDLAPGNATTATVVALIAVALAYYLATAMFVRRSQRVSVPGAPRLFSF